MEVAVRRGALVLGTGGALSLVAPVNDLLGAREQDWEYALHLESSYGSFWPETWIALPPDVEPADLSDDERAAEAQAARIERIGAEAGRVHQEGLPQLFLSAAGRAEEGHLSAEIAPFLERVLRRPGDEPDEVPDADLPALAAWALDEVLRISGLEVRECPLCKVPWVASPSQASAYCERPFPGRRMSCRELKKDEHFRESQRDWRREYKRVHERVRRGTVSEAEWQAWRADNSPDAWIAFDTWIERNRWRLEPGALTGAD